MERGSEASKQGKRARKGLKFKEILTNLFDITFCQCLHFTSCCRPKEMRVPKRDQSFLTDQRAMRNMHIGELDKTVSEANKRKHDRENQPLERKEEEKRQRFEREKQLSSSDSELAFAVDIDATSSCSCNSSSIFGEELSNLVPKTGM